MAARERHHRLVAGRHPMLAGASALLLAASLVASLGLPGTATSRVTSTLLAGGAADAPGWGCGPGPEPTSKPTRTHRPERTRRPVPTPTTTPEAAASDAPDPDVSPEAVDPAASEAPQPEPEPTARPRKTPKPTRRPTPEPSEEPTPEPTPDATPEPTDAPAADPGAGSDQPSGMVGGLALAAVTGGDWDVTPGGRLADQIAPSVAPSPEPATGDGKPSVDWQAFADWLGSGAGDLTTAASDTSPDSASPGQGADASPASSPAFVRVPEPTPTPDRASDGSVAGIDISHWNGRVRFDLVDAAGARFVLIKATQGTDIVDPAFQRHVDGARAALLLVGAYHFYDYRVDGRTQADHFIDALDAAGALSGTLPPVVDIECFEPFGSADQAFVRQQLRAFADRVFERTGRLPMVYTSGTMWRAVTGGADDFGDLPLWVACWRCASPGLPAGWDDWLFWQTGSTVLDGTGDRIGSDRFRGDASELQALAGDFRVAAGRQATAHRDVRVPLRLLDGEEARLSIDRAHWTDWLPTRGAVTIRLPDRDGRYRVWVRTRTADGVRGPLRADAIVLDRAAPRIDDPVVSIGAVDPPIDDGSMTADLVTTVRDGTSGIARVTVQADCGGGWVMVDPVLRYRRGDSVAEVRVGVPIRPGVTCRVRIRAVDDAGNASRVTTDPLGASTGASADPTSTSSALPPGGPPSTASASPSAEPAPSSDQTPP